MTLFLGTPIAFILGLTVGRRREAYALAALAWYALLAAQTISIAHPDKTAFFGRSGLETVRWTPYWLVQPFILALAVAVLYGGARLRTRFLPRSVKLA